MNALLSKRDIYASECASYHILPHIYQTSSYWIIVGSPGYGLEKVMLEPQDSGVKQEK